MKTGRYYLSYFLRKLWLLLAVFTVGLALLISLLRYSLPYMHSQRDFIESWLSDNYGANIKIGYISAMWKGRGPAIVLKDLTLVEGKNSPISFSVDETQVELDLFTSLRTGQVHSRRFNLIGMEMKADIDKIQGGESNFPVVDALQTLFLEQLQRFSVSDSHVTIKTRLDEQQIQIQQLSWLNNGKRHQGVGEMRVAELASNSARFVLDLKGEKRDLTGTFYAEARDLDIAPWLKEFVPTQYELIESRANFQFWAGLRNSVITSTQVLLQDSSFEWENEAGDVVNAKIFKGNFLAQPRPSGWAFNMNEFTVVVNEKAIETNWNGTFSRAGVLRFHNREPVKFSPVMPLLSVILGTNEASPIAALAPDLQIDKLHIELSPEQAAAQLLFSNLSFSELSSENGSSIPGVTNLKGNIHWLDKLARVQVYDDLGELRTGQMLGYNLPYDHISLDAYLDLSSDKLAVSAPSIRFQGPSLTAETSVTYRSDTKLMQLYTRLGNMDIDQAKALFPKELMGPVTNDFLKESLHAGTLSDIHSIWSGDPSEFPFKNNQGIFQAKLSLSDAQFEFDDTWPMVTELNVDLLFENEGLFMASQHARILDVTVDDIHASIPNLTEGSTLFIDVKGQTTGTLATGLVQASSLQESVGEALDHVHLSGPLDLDVDLEIPLSGENIQVKGNVNMANNPIYIPRLDLRLEQSRGAIAFNNDKVSTSALSAELWGQPISIDFVGHQGEDAYEADIDISGKWDADELTQTFHPNLNKYFDGATDWQADLRLSIPQTGFYYSMQLTSQMEGVGIALPDPIAKEAEDSRLLFLDSEGDEKTSTVRMLLGDNIKFNGILPHDKKQFSRAHLTIGEDSFIGMGIGFSVSAQLNTMTFNPWFDFVDDMLSGLPESAKGGLLSPPQRVLIKANELHFGGQQFNKVDVVAKNRDTDWDVLINAEQLRAQALVAKALYSQGMKVNADFVNIKSWNKLDEDLTQEIDFSQLPPLQVKCLQCKIDDFDLGELDFALMPTQSGMKIDRFKLKKKDGSISATGDWQIDAAGHKTNLKGSFESKDFGDFLSSLDYESGVRDSDAKIDFDLKWDQAPYQPQFATLNGNVQWRLGDGYLTEVSDNGARIFSFLSLESLIRKLTLDFRDVFAKGFFYEKMKGSFQISDGRMQTQDSEIDGAAARVKIQGYTDLSDKQLNYTVSVQPNLTSSLPVLLAWMVNPATAVAAFAFDEVITSANVVSNLKYSLTGTLSDPKVELLDKSSKSVELPAKKSPVEPSVIEPETENSVNPGLEPNSFSPFQGVNG
ncbi:YhdP family protein [Alteromonas sp. a30]|uniref:YhdP family protein n=1 Tax=Alteromonas sp. a30 TaxID=2730917 RepID=UPI002280E811|nr:YhdP family protein [Alteromonas sp. a30]MCY7295256.1 TIGR02099 family protein [Alteromonas sp. a30]